VSDKLSLWQARGDAPLLALELGDLELGDAPAGGSADTQFRVRNGSLVYTATGVRLALSGPDAGQLWLSTDGATFADTLALGDLPPTGVSPIVTLRRVTGAATPAGQAQASLHLITDQWTD
jgi:hypothetical protein